MVNNNGIDRNLRPFKRTLSKIKKYSLSEYPDSQIKAMSHALKERALNGETLQILLPEAFAVTFEAIKRTLGLTPFDVQLLAAAVLAKGRIIEFPTGEGKTLTAVFAAYLHALTGEGVHVLTFNDYLAKRDALWMKPVYDFLDVSVRYINEGMSTREHKDAYSADITYVTAKEAGFDYLKSFLAYHADDVVQRDFKYAIIDEADSILIDEARVPLVIAGDISTLIEIEKKVFHAVSKLERDLHFETDEYEENIFLTETGVDMIEKDLRLDNLYDVKNVDILAKINVILQAQFLLKKDVDYIVRKDEVQIVDEFTGRIMKNRQWPDGLQNAVELKEGLIPLNKGVVMNSITLQNFLKLYPSICGMTGTSCSAAPEFHEFYNKAVTVIPSNRPCIRIDQPDVVFTHKDAKYRAVAVEIIKEHTKGRPILVGTSSIEESEHLADMIREAIPDINVLNARNDSEEADIIANAGKLHTVTISTNMAGRGVDIQLGGRVKTEYQRICALGGLYVIGTNRFESVRIDNQLRGRAGRQGDPGESRFFISLEDNLIVKYRVNDVIPPKYRGIKQEQPLQNPLINRAILHTQKVVEGQTFDAKLTLSKYSYLVDDQRKLVHKKRDDILRGDTALSFFEKTSPEKYRELLTQVSKEEFERAQKEIELFAINKCWADHLQFIESAMDGVQIISMAKGDPFLHYNQELVDAFEHFENHIGAVIKEIYETLIVRNGQIDLNEMGVTGPASTRTYLVHDGTELQNFLNEFNASVSAPLYAFYLFYDKYIKKRAD